MTSAITTSPFALVPSLETAWQDVDSSFERFCLTAGIGAIEQMLCEDAQQLAGGREFPTQRKRPMPFEPTETSWPAGRAPNSGCPEETGERNFLTMLVKSREQRCGHLNFSLAFLAGE